MIKSFGFVILFISLSSCSPIKFTANINPSGCQDESCAPTDDGVSTWHIGAWGTCSQSCGGGTQSRVVICANQILQPVPEDRCQEVSPVSTRVCHSQACNGTPTWNIGPWSTCSTTCGGGLQTRVVECRDSSGVVVESSCLDNKPELQQLCNPQACTCPTKNEVLNLVVPADKNKVDILLVIDDSSSMALDNQKLAERLKGFVADLQNNNLDWQMCVTTTDVGYYEGRPIVWSGTSKRVVNRNTLNLSNVFQQTIYDIGSGFSNDEQGIKASILSILNNPVYPCYRPNAAMAVLLISDEDERSVGGNKNLSLQQYQALGVQNYPATFVNTVSGVFGPTKKVAVNSIVVRDPQCKQNQDAQGSSSFIGVKYMELANLTNGVIGNICDSDYSTNLKYFKDSILSTVSSVNFNCNPINSPVVSLPSGYTWTIQTHKVTFTPALNAGVSLSMSYQCCTTAVQPIESPLLLSPTTTPGQNPLGVLSTPAPTLLSSPLPTPTVRPTVTSVATPVVTPLAVVSPVVTSTARPIITAMASPISTPVTLPNYSLIYYVSPKGLDSNNGTSLSTPLKTIKTALTKAVSGNAIYVLTGTYVEVVRVSTNQITLSAYPNHKPVIDGQTTLPTSDWSSLLSISGNNNIISGFEVRNTNINGTHLGGYGVEVIGHHNTLSNMTVHHSWETGVLVAGDYNIVEDSSIYQASYHQSNAAVQGSRSSGWASGMSAARNHSAAALKPGITSYTIFRRNKVYNNWGEGLSCFEADHCTMEDNLVYDNWTVNLYISDATNCLVQRNIIYVSSTPAIPTRNNSHPGLLLADEVSGVPRSANNTIINNFVYNAGISGFSWTQVPNSGLNNVLIANNTIVDGSLSTGGPADNVVNLNSQIKNNIILGANSSVPSKIGIVFSNNNWKTTPTEGKSLTDIIGDPQISRAGNTTAGNLTGSYFKILSSSPVINAGVALPKVSEDYFKTIRGSTAPDLGGHELR